MVGIAAFHEPPGIRRIVDITASIEVDQFRPFFTHKCNTAGIIATGSKRGKPVVTQKTTPEQPHHESGRKPFGNHIVDHFQHALSQIPEGIADRFGA